MNNKLLTGLAIGAGLVIAAFLAVVFHFNPVIALVFGFLAFLAVSFLLSNTPQEVADEATKIEMASATRRAQQLLGSIQQLARQAGLTATVSDQTSKLVGYAQGILKDMKTPQKASVTKLQELNSYLGDFSEALTSYAGIKNGNIVLPPNTNKVQTLASFEQALPKFVQGFNALAANVDADDAALIQLKTMLLEQKMLSRGRLSDEVEKS